MGPVAFRLGPISIRWYGLILMTGTLIAAYIASLEARRRSEDPDHVWNALSLCLIFGIIGARLYHVISSPQFGVGWDYYRQHPLEIIAFWRGFQGFGIYGAVMGGIVGLYIYTRLNKLNFLRWADIAVPGLLLAQAIGRWGNFFNQELYGYPTDLPWGVYISPENRLPGFESFERFHPTFLYESLWNLLAFLALMYVARRYSQRLLDGDLLCLYGILYPLGRFFIEFQRPDAWKVGGIAVAQLIAIASIIACVVIMVYRRRARRRARLS